MNFLLQKFENEVLSYENKIFFSATQRGDVILSRSNRTRVAFRSDYNHMGKKGFLASFQAGTFL